MNIIWYIWCLHAGNLYSRSAIKPEFAAKSILDIRIHQALRMMLFLSYKEAGAADTLKNK